MEFDKKQFEDSKEMLEQAAEKLKSFTEGIGKNPAVLKAKTTHLDQMKSILIGVLEKHSKDQVNLGSDAAINTIADEFIKAYDETVLTPLGM